MDRLLDTLVSRALRRGRQGEPLWLVVGVCAWLWRRSRRTKDKTIWSGRVEAGERLLVTIADPRARQDAVAARG